MRTCISVMIDAMPDQLRPEYTQPSPEQRVREAIELVNSGYDSATEWEFLRSLNNSLIRKSRDQRLSERELGLLRMMEPTIQKYGQLDEKGVERNPELDLQGPREPELKQKER